MPSPTPSGDRVHSLDGLRGAAAFAVFLSHVAIVSPSLSRTATANPGTVSGTVLRILAYSPLRLTWAGPEAVVVFFVLSGYVLSRPFATDLDRSWAAYYGKRVVRLYLPVFGAIAFSVAVILTVRPQSIFVGNDPLNGFSRRFGSWEVLQDALLLFQPGYWNAVLWSLKWEVIFSLLLPMFVVFGRLSRSRSWITVVVLLAMMASTLKTDLAFRYMPMFGFGALLALTEYRWRPKMSIFAGRAGWLLRSLVALACMALLNCTWLMIGTNKPRLIRLATSPKGIVGEHIAITLGAVLLVVISLTYPGVVRVLNSRLLQWLGSRSYSLYLVHFPIVVSTAYLFKGWSWTGLLVMIGVSLCVTEVFFRLVERPSIRLASIAGTKVRQRVEIANQQQPPSRVAVGERD